jgi:hypothetical protein
MQTPPPVGSPLGVLFLIVGIYLLIKSPKKLQTLGRMALTFFVTVLLIVVINAILRIGDPRVSGQLAGLVGLLAAVIAGYLNLRSLRRAVPPQEKLPSQV